MLEESVVYQDIMQKGERRGLQKGLEQGLERERKLVTRQLEQLLGKLALPIRRRLAKLTLEQVETLGEALLKFRSEQELAAWLKEHEPAR